MRWLLISSQHHPSHGGIGTYISRFTESAIKAGWQVDLITRRGPHQPAGSTIHEVETIDERPDFARRLPALRRIERVRPYRYALWSRAVADCLLTLDDDYDGIEFVDCQAEGFAALGSHQLRCRFAATPMIVHAHTPMFVEEQINGVDLSRFGRSIYHDWERRSIQMADGVITTSELLLSRLPLRRTHSSRVIPYPIARGDDLREQRHPVSSETILLIGSVQPRKGVEVWAQSLNTVLRQRRTAHAILIGPDTPTSPSGASMADYITGLIDADLRERFHFAGPLAHNEVQRMIGEAVVVVVPSLFESFSFVAAEALTAGTPVIVSDHVGIAEHVDGLPAVPAGDADALAEAQLHILADPESARREVTRSREAMFRACDPKGLLHLRAEFAEQLKARLRSHSAASTSSFENVSDELAGFIEAVEQAERDSAEVSSVVS